VENAFKEYLQTRLTRGSQWELWMEKLDYVRSHLSTLLVCQPDEIAITPSVSVSLNSIISALDFSSGRNKVVVTDFDFPTTSQIWMAQQQHGANIVRAKANENGSEIPLSEFEKLIDEQTLIVSIPYVCYHNGSKLDPKPVIEMAHKYGAMVLIDGYQGIGTFPIDLKNLDVDFITGGCTKYLIGTSGVGFLYVNSRTVSKLQPTATGWFAQDDINAMDIYHHRPSRTASRFESGTPSVSGLYAVEAGLKFILNIGISKIDSQINKLTASIKKQTLENGWQLVTPEDPEKHGAMIAIKSNDAPQLVSRLAKADIVVSDRNSNLRISTHFYNNEDDLDHLFAELKNNEELLLKKI
jgi:selenocysteine lyase/cysteine desulfurase